MRPWPIKATLQFSPLIRIPKSLSIVEKHLRVRLSRCLLINRMLRPQAWPAPTVWVVTPGIQFTWWVVLWIWLWAVVETLDRLPSVPSIAVIEILYLCVRLPKDDTLLFLSIGICLGSLNELQTAPVTLTQCIPYQKLSRRRKAPL